jgi:TatD DNase family protein
MIDSHCHLAAEQFADDVDAVIARAAAAGVTTMVCIGDTIEESEKGLHIAEKNEQIFCTVGVHPHESSKWSLVTKPAPQVSTRDDILRLVRSSKKVVAIGEIGLDYHYDFSPRDVQRDVFRTQLHLANELRLPVVVHCREAVEDVWTIVNELKPEKLVIHCCTEKWSDVKRFVDRGYLLSFTGIATYPKSDDIRETIKQCPLEQMMIETDAPFLAPVPHRGKRNEPAFVIDVAKCVAEIKRLSLQDVDKATTRNAVEFFSLR